MSDYPISSNYNVPSEDNLHLLTSVIFKIIDIVTIDILFVK